MPNVSLGAHFDAFVQDQVENGRFQNVSEVVRAGLRLLEDHEADRAERLADIKRRIQESLDDPRPSVPAEEVFRRLDRLHAETVKAHRRETS